MHPCSRLTPILPELLSSSTRMRYLVPQRYSFPQHSPLRTTSRHPPKPPPTPSSTTPIIPLIIRIPTPSTPNPIRIIPRNPSSRTRRPRPTPKPSLQPLLRRPSTTTTSSPSTTTTRRRARIHPPTARRLETLITARALAGQRPRGSRNAQVASRLWSCSRRPNPSSCSQALRRRRRSWRRSRGIPEVVQTTSVTITPASLELAAAAGAGVVALPLALGLLRVLRLRAAGVGVWGQPGGERAGFFGVVGAQGAGDVRVVFGVAVVFAAEEGAAEGVVAACGCCEEIGEVGGHFGGVFVGQEAGFECFVWLVL